MENKSLALPYKLFEVGDCIVVDDQIDTGAKNIRKIAAVFTDEINDQKSKGIFSFLHGTLDNLMKKSNLQFTKDYSLRKSNDPIFFQGQQFEVVLKDQVIGRIGVIHPNVLHNFNWLHPTVMWELDVAPLETAFTNSYK